jgi:hypothetical protein
MLTFSRQIQGFPQTNEHPNHGMNTRPPGGISLIQWPNNHALVTRPPAWPAGLMMA